MQPFGAQTGRGQQGKVPGIDDAVVTVGRVGRRRIDVETAVFGQIMDLQKKGVAHFLQPLHHEGGGFVHVVHEFGMLMQMVPPGGHLGVHFGQTVADRHDLSILSVAPAGAP